MLPGGALFNCASQVLAPPESIRHLYTLRDAPPPCEVQEGESCRILHLNDRTGHYVCADILLVAAVRCRVRDYSFPAVWRSGY